MPAPVWYSVLVIGLACLGWGFWLAPSPSDDTFRVGYLVAGALCTFSFAAYFLKHIRTAIAGLVAGAASYLLFPGRPIARLIFYGEWQRLIETVRATYRVPELAGHTAIQAFAWRLDLLLFGITLTIYFIVISMLLFGFHVVLPLTRRE